jgi:acyl-coenzyme A synthetase/AMP-(fatty) acid ligase/surfactin synthase thioesterase subunit
MTGTIPGRAWGSGAELAVADPAAVAYLDPDLGEVSYGRLRAGVDRYAARLAALGPAPGRAAVVVADDSTATVAAVLALWRLGCVPAVISPLLTDEEIAFVLDDCAAALVHLDVPPDRAAVLVDRAGARPVTTGDQARADLAAAGPGGSGARPEPPAADPAATVLLQYTSGSTGRPKAVRHTARGLDAVERGFASVLGLTPADRVLSTAKLSFGYGFGNSLLFPLAAGASAVLHRGPVDGLVLSQLLRRHRPTVLMAVPRIYGGLLALARAGRAPDLTGVRLAVSAGEHLPAAMSEELRERYGLPVLNGLGATEVLHIVAATRPGVDPPGSTGRAVPGVTLSARDPGGVPVPACEIGRLHVAGDCVAAGYLNRPEEEARTFADGGAYTGDLVRIVDGTVQYLCRADDVLTVGGQRIPPQEIERVLRTVAGVADCAVVAGTGALGLQEVHAYLVPDAAVAADPDSLVARVTEQMRGQPAQLRPGRVTVVDALPTTSTGKLARFQLRAASPAAAGPRVRRVVLRGGGTRKLVAVPYAGGTADAYTELAAHLPPDWAVVSGDVGGDRDGGVDPLAEAWWAAVAADLVPGSVLFGHSLGACVALTLAAWRPVELTGVTVVLSGLPLGGAAGRAGELDDAALLAWMRAHGALPDAELTDEELVRLVLPRFRRDLEGVHGSWPRLRPEGPVHLVTGSGDLLCRQEDLRSFSAGWPQAHVHVLDGADHRLPTHGAAALAAFLRDLAGRG